MTKFWQSISMQFSMENSKVNTIVALETKEILCIRNYTCNLQYVYCTVFHLLTVNRDIWIYKLKFVSGIWVNEISISKISHCISVRFHFEVFLFFFARRHHLTDIRKNCYKSDTTKYVVNTETVRTEKVWTLNIGERRTWMFEYSCQELLPINTK